MTRTVWVVMAALIVVLGGTAIAMKKKKSTPHQEIARAVLVPTEKKRLVLVPPCGTGVPVASTKPAALEETPGTIRILLNAGRGDRILTVPRCQAAQGSQPSEGVNLPSAAFVLPIGAKITAGRGGSAEAGTEKVQSQLVVPANSSIETIVVPRCIESKKQAEKTATGRAIILNPTRAEPKVALAPPC